METFGLNSVSQTFMLVGLQPHQGARSLGRGAEPSASSSQGCLCCRCFRTWGASLSGSLFLLESSPLNSPPSFLSGLGLEVVPLALEKERTFQDPDYKFFFFHLLLTEKYCGLDVEEFQS